MFYGSSADLLECCKDEGMEGATGHSAILALFLVVMVMVVKDTAFFMLSIRTSSRASLYSFLFNSLEGGQNWI